MPPFAKVLASATLLCSLCSAALCDSSQGSCAQPEDATSLLQQKVAAHAGSARNQPEPLDKISSENGKPLERQNAFNCGDVDEAKCGLECAKEVEDVKGAVCKGIVKITCSLKSVFGVSPFGKIKQKGFVALADELLKPKVHHELFTSEAEAAAHYAASAITNSPVGETVKHATSAVVAEVGQNAVVDYVGKHVQDSANAGSGMNTFISLLQLLSGMCKAWTPCPSGYDLEAHTESNRGDVCLKAGDSGDSMPPNGCKIGQAPLDTVDIETDKICRKATKCDTRVDSVKIALHLTGLLMTFFAYGMPGQTIITSLTTKMVEVVGKMMCDLGLNAFIQRYLVNPATEAWEYFKNKIVSVIYGDASKDASFMTKLREAVTCAPGKLSKLATKFGCMVMMLGRVIKQTVTEFANKFKAAVSKESLATAYSKFAATANDVKVKVKAKLGFAEEKRLVQEQERNRQICCANLVDSAIEEGEAEVAEDSQGQNIDAEPKDLLPEGAVEKELEGAEGAEICAAEEEEQPWPIYSRDVEEQQVEAMRGGFE